VIYVANKYESDKDTIFAGESEMTSALKEVKFHSMPSLFSLMWNCNAITVPIQTIFLKTMIFSEQDTTIWSKQKVRDTVHSNTPKL